MGCTSGGEVDLVGNTHRVLFFTISILYVSLCLKLPVSIYTTANYDDALFWNNAESILSGNWLGNYNDLTLLKGVGFPIFLIINNVIGLPITLSIAIFYLLSLIIFLKVLIKYYNINIIFCYLIFTLVLFHPQIIPTRIIRDDIYASLLLLFFSGIISLYNFDLKKGNKYSLVPYALAGGFFLLTREEGIWVFPAFFILLFYKFFQIYKNHQLLKLYINNILIFAFSVYFPIGVVSTINYLYYGKYISTESFISSGPYTDALKALNAINAGSNTPHIPVSYAKRLEAYRVSPSFLKLKDYFERDGRWWTQPGCDVYPDTCGDYAGGWFMFALRGAVTSVGFYHTPKEADDFYTKIATEIESACKEKIISCNSTKIPFMPRLTADEWRQIPQKAISLFKMAILQNGAVENGSESWGPSDLLIKTKLFLGSPSVVRSNDENLVELNGWYYNNSGEWIDLFCIDARGLSQVTPIVRHNSPDLADYFKDPSAQKIKFKFKIFGKDNCRIVLNNTNEPGIGVAEIVDQNSSFNIGNGQLYINSVTNTLILDEYRGRYKIKEFLYKIYKNIMPLIFYIGIISYVFISLLAVFNNKDLRSISAVITAVWILLLSRSLLLVMIDISSFPAITPLYFGSGFILVLIAALLSMYVLLKFIFYNLYRTNYKK